MPNPSLNTNVLVEELIKTQKDEGCTFNYIYANATCVTDRIALTGVIERLTRKGSIHKVGDLYFGSHFSPKPEVIKSVPQATPTKVIPMTVKRTVVQPLEVTAERGQLRRGAISGKVVYLFYVLDHLLPNRGLSNREIEDLLKITASASLYQILVKLVREDYLETVSGTASNGVFKWSKRFSYPFQTVDSHDKFMVDTAAILKFLTPKSEIDAESNKEEHPLIDFLQQEIQHYELAILRCKEQIEKLRA